MHVLSMPGGAWNFGASILSFLFPMILFVLVATTLYVLYTKPEVVPGHPAGTLDRPVSYTPIPRPPAAGAPATAEDTVADTGTTGSTDGKAPGTGDGA